MKYEEVVKLHSSQEEADTRMLLHCAYIRSAVAPPSDDCHDIVIKSPDTDVFILAVLFSGTLGGRILFHTGKGKTLGTVDVSTLNGYLGDEKTRSLIGLHCLTGCDAVSGFKWKGKVRPAKLLLHDVSTYPVFATIGESFDVDDNQASQVEEFVCHLYGQEDCADTCKVLISSLFLFFFFFFFLSFLNVLGHDFGSHKNVI